MSNYGCWCSGDICVFRATKHALAQVKEADSCIDKAKIGQDHSCELQGHMVAEKTKIHEWTQESGTAKEDEGAKGVSSKKTRMTAGQEDGRVK